VQAEHSITRCLDAIDVDRAGRRVEVVVVASPDDATVTRAVSGRRDTRLVHVDADALTPRMWSEGVAVTSSPAFALLTAHCFVVPGWSSALLAGLGDAAACGGPLRLADDATAVDAAIFFLRYSAYLDDAPRPEVRDIAGDNAAYMRATIPQSSWSRESGFWEHDVNRELLREGRKIAWAPGAVVQFGKSFSLASICRHRFEHGRLFGIARRRRGENRLRIFGASPAVPFVLLIRSWKRVSRFSPYRGKFIRSLPLILLIAFCWAIGEATGALEAGNAHRS
jgi:hypothetical protein